MNLGRMAIYFHGVGEEWGAQANKQGYEVAGENGHFSFREQRAKTATPCPGRVSSYRISVNYL